MALSIRPLFSLVTCNFDFDFGVSKINDEKDKGTKSTYTVVFPSVVNVLNVELA